LRDITINVGQARRAPLRRPRERRRDGIGSVPSIVMPGMP